MKHYLSAILALFIGSARAFSAPKDANPTLVIKPDAPAFELGRPVTLKLVIAPASHTIKIPSDLASNFKQYAKATRLSDDTVLKSLKEAPKQRLESVLIPREAEYEQSLDLQEAFPDVSTASAANAFSLTGEYGIEVQLKVECDGAPLDLKCRITVQIVPPTKETRAWANSVVDDSAASARAKGAALTVLLQAPEPALVNRLIAKADPGVHYKLLNHLEGMTAQVRHKVVETGAVSGSDLVRARAVDAAAGCLPEKNWAALIARAVKDPSEMVRLAFVRKASPDELRDFLPILKQWAADKTSPHLQQEAVQALARAEAKN